MDTGERARCERCPTRRTNPRFGKEYKVKDGPGYMCQRCYDKGRGKVAAAPATATLTNKRKRRAQSDPGKSARREAKIARLLDETHARRMAALAASIPTVSTPL